MGRFSRVLLALGLGVSVCGCALLLGQPEPLSRAPRLEADFGAVPAGQIVEEVFVVDNPTRAPLGLSLRAASCRCSVDMEETAVVAGGRAKVRVQLATQTLGGEVVRVVELATTDPERETLQLVLRGRVDRPVRADPEVLYFPQIASGRRSVREVELLPAAGVAILRVRSASGRLGLGRASDQPERGLRVRVAPPAGLPAGGHEDRLIVELRGAALAQVEIPVLFFVAQ